MAGSLFDNRYRYDYIYPRGRSGETLRAYDTHDADRPVVIKRPAPQDAPPIRHGQEVSILNERKALTRLAGHPVLTQLLGSGQFSISGAAHQYIVMERAEGIIVADLVLELAQRGERMPELEMLNVIDGLLDLLNAAHQNEIVYNDVDAKHLFWNRDDYRLKVIDWGNAVFLEGDEITAQGISRQSDIYQVGELMYFILTGGGRIEVPRDAGDDFRVSLPGDDGARINSRLVSIISRAVHPNLKLRYSSVLEMRKDLTDYRTPIERERSAVIGRVKERLRRHLSREELTGLMRALEPALAMDPGYPPARQAHTAILSRQSDLEVSADLDAARIYLESGNWNRGITVLDELRPRARGTNAAMIGLLIDWCALLLNSGINPAPDEVFEALALIFDDDATAAAYHLITTNRNDLQAYRLQLLLAERISAHAGDILLLRPNLYRLEAAFEALQADGIAVGEAQAFLRDINSALDDLARFTRASLTQIRDGYRAVVDQMTALATFLGTIRAQHQLTNARLPLSSLTRATNAAMALADNMHVIGKQAVNSPRDARDALSSSRVIEPLSPVWEALGRLLDNLYELLASYQIYVPAADGSDLSAWLRAAESDLEPFNERLFDEMLVGMTLGLRTAAESWDVYAERVIQGNRIGAVTALSDAIDAISTISPTLAGWLNQVRGAVGTAGYVERHALYGGLGRAIADGWEHFDRGRLNDAERLGGQAYDIARNDTEREAARRLRDLASLAREWVERNGILDQNRTADTLAKAELLYTADEITARNQFAAQMPSMDTFLKAMNKGLTEGFARESSAALRILFFNYVLYGAQDAQEQRLDDAAFWLDASQRVLSMGDAIKSHPLPRALADYIQRRKDLSAAAELLNSINGAHAIPTLESARSALEQNPQARALAPAVYSLREIEAAARDWSEGEFRAAGNKIDNAVRAVDDVESNAGVTLTGYRAWLMRLSQAAAELHTASRRMQTAIERREAQPDPVVLETHRLQAGVTDEVLGAAFAGNLRQWLTTYERFLDIYTDPNSRRSVKLNRFNDLFRAMFIDRHPAYPLYRHWYDLTEQSPEFPAPPTDEPTPRIAEDDDDLTPFVRMDNGEDEGDDDHDAPPPPRRRGGLGVIAIGVGGVLLLVIAAMLVLNGGAGGDNDPTPDTSTTNAALLVAAAETETIIPTDTDAPTETRTPSATVPAVLATVPPRGDESATPTRTPSNTPIPTTPAPSMTPTSSITHTPTNTRTPSPTHTPSITPTPSRTPFPTPPPNGLLGEFSLFPLLEVVENPAWTAEELTLNTESDPFYRFGVGTGTGGEIALRIPPELLDRRFGGNAPQRVQRVEVEMELVTFNPPLAIDDQVYFGAYLEPVNNPAQRAGVEIRWAQAGVFNIGQRIGDQVTISAQRSVNEEIATIRLERNFSANTLTVYVNGGQVGLPIPFEGGDAVVPVIYVRRGGVIVHVNRWQVVVS